MDLTAKAKYSLEVTSDELFTLVKGLSKLCGEPGRSRDGDAYVLLDKLQGMVNFIERCEKAVETAANPEPEESSTDRSGPVLPPIPSVPGPPALSADTSKASGPSDVPEGAPRPPAPPVTDRPLALPPSIQPLGPPPAPPKSSSTKKAKRTKKKAKS